MQYQVPQFIEIEDKIFGPLTFKQFIYILGGLGGGFMVYKVVPTPFSYILIIPIIGFGVALAFYKINERPLISTLEAGFKYLLSPKLYLWKKKEVLPEKTNIESLLGEERPLVAPNLTAGKLSEIAWGLDITENIATPRKTEMEKTFKI